MVVKNLISRELNSDNRRMLKIVLSDKGKRLAKSIEKEYIAMYVHILNQTGGNKREAVVTSMQELLNSMEKFNKELRRK